MTGIRRVTVKTPAKVNLTLEVLGRRDDGYHEIASVMQAVSLFDTLTLFTAESVSLSSDVPELETRDNLVYRAADLIKREKARAEGVDIRLHKGIPIAGGMGGGSSDAAATLLGINVLWGLDLDNRELEKLAAQLGSDVPFFVSGGTALAKGRGELISPLPSPQIPWLVLAYQPNPLDEKTASAYGALTPDDYTDGRSTTRLVSILENGAVPDSPSLFNVFDSGAKKLFPGIDKAWAALEAVSGAPVHLSGAGPTLFCLVEGRSEGERVVGECIKRGLDCRLVRTLGPGEGPRLVSNA